MKLLRHSAVVCPGSIIAATLCHFCFITLGVAGLLITIMILFNQTPMLGRGSFAIVGADKSTIKLDTSTGDSWILNSREDGQAGWRPIISLELRAKEIQDKEVLSSNTTSPVYSLSPNSLHDSLLRSGYTAVHFDTMNSGYIAIKAQLNGHALNMVLDTGAPTSHLDRDRTVQSEITWNSRITMDGDNVSLKDPTWYTKITLKLADKLTFREMTVTAYDMKSINDKIRPHNDAPLDGIIGADILKSSMAIIDYASNTIFLQHSDM